MGLLKHFRSRSRLKDGNGPKAATYPSPPQLRYTGRDCTKRLPDSVLERIFTYVCPHVEDTTCEPIEKSQVGEGCLLCDLRELSECASLCWKWRRSAEELLYKSIRIDPVHYCEREYDLSELRKKKHGRSKSAIPPTDPAATRLALLCRTVWARPDLAARTEFFKINYMTRETAKADLARTVAAMPNLRYVDLPDGFFTGDSSCATLRQELQTRCPNIRKMTYRQGSEVSLQLLTQRHWRRLEVLELSGIVVEPATLRIVLASLPKLYDLTLSNIDWMDDTIFQPLPPQLPDFPPLHTLSLLDVPRITTQGLKLWLAQAGISETLSSLKLQGTGVAAKDLHSILPFATSLRDLAIVEAVSSSLGLAAQQLPPLTSRSLKSLSFEITNAEDPHGLQKPAESYYSYLAASLHQNGLPSLATVYVRDPTFPELLVLPLPPAPFAGGAKSNGFEFNQTLEVFAKGIDESDWVFTSIMPPDRRQNRDSTIAVGGRPLSAYSASRGLGPQWAQGGFGGEARRSVIVGNGFGGFLAVPQEEAPRPVTSDGSSSPGWGGRRGGGDDAGFGLLKPPAIFGSGGHGHARKGSKRDLWR